MSKTDPLEADDSRQRHGRPKWLLGAVAAVSGCLIGLAGFTFAYGDGTAYLSNKPTACTNCHIMQDHFDSWQQSSHRHVAVCNDCHLPPGFVGKWVTKADNGFLHSVAFTTGDFPEPLRIKPRNRRRTQEACIKCHTTVAEALKPAVHGGDMLNCVDCHSDVGHAHR